MGKPEVILDWQQQGNSLLERLHEWLGDYASVENQS